jgi:hypothetical protein
VKAKPAKSHTLPTHCCAIAIKMQPQYRAYAQQQVPQRSPHAPNQRRGGIGTCSSAMPFSDAPILFISPKQRTSELVDRY